MILVIFYMINGQFKNILYYRGIIFKTLIQYYYHSKKKKHKYHIEWVFFFLTSFLP